MYDDNMLRKKQRVMINLPPEIVKKARNLGLNISKVAENALVEAIKRLGSPVFANKPDIKADHSHSDVVREVGFEPTKAYANRA